MCGQWLCPELPQTNVVYRVAYCHVTQQWHASARAETTLADGTVIVHGGKTVDFGPFDGATEVARWVHTEVTGQTKIMPLRDNLTAQDPPQGRTLPDSNESGSARGGVPLQGDARSLPPFPRLDEHPL